MKRHRSSQSLVQDGVVDDAEWTYGDFTIISSDNVCFRVNKHLVLGASKVLRDADQVTSGPNRIELTDPVIETAGVIRRFLQLLSSGSPGDDIESNVGAVELGEAVALLSLLRKLDCPAFLQTMKLYARDLERQDALAAFVLAAHLDDNETCVDAARMPVVWDHDPKQNAASSASTIAIAGTNELHPGGMSFALYQLIPPKYLFCLCRAWAISPELTRSKGEACEPIASTLENLLKEM